MNPIHRPQDRSPAHVHQIRDSSLSLRRLCDKLKVKCPLCEYVTERALLADHLSKCQSSKSKKSSSPQKTRQGRSKSRDAAKKLSPVKWHRSRENGLDQITRDQRSRSRDHLDYGRRGRSRSRERVLDEVDLAREIERDIERINMAQAVTARRHRSVPIVENQVDLNQAQIHSDISSSSSGSAERNYFTVPSSPTARLLDVQIPLEEKLDGLAGINIGRDWYTLKGLFSTLHADCSAYSRYLFN